MLNSDFELRLSKCFHLMYIYVLQETAGISFTSGPIADSVSDSSQVVVVLDGKYIMFFSKI